MLRWAMTDSTTDPIEQVPQPEAARCDLCSSVRSIRMFSARTVGTRGPVLMCADCGLVRLAHDDHARRVYTDGSFHGRYELKRSEGESDWPALHARRLPSARERLRLLAGAVDLARSQLLEVGTGAGSFLSLVAPLCASARGIEPNPSLALFCREALRLQVSDGWAEEVVPSLAPSSFDVVCMLHVLEHIAAPGRLLQAVRRILRPGGVLHVELPNLVHDFRRAGTDLRRFVCDPHRYYFTDATLSALLGISGFEIVRRERPRPHWLAVLARPAREQRSATRARPIAMKAYLTAWHAWSLASRSKTA